MRHCSLPSCRRVLQQAGERVCCADSHRSVAHVVAHAQHSLEERRFALLLAADQRQVLAHGRARRHCSVAGTRQRANRIGAIGM